MVMMLTEATNWQLLVCSLKKAGITEPPLYAKAQEHLEQSDDYALKSWFSRKEPEESEMLLRIHWE